MNNHTTPEKIHVRYFGPEPGKTLPTWSGDKLNSGDYLGVFVRYTDVQRFSDLVDLDRGDRAAEKEYWQQRRTDRLEKERKAFIKSVTSARRNSSQELAAIELEVIELEQKQSELEAQWEPEAAKEWEAQQAKKREEKQAAVSD